MRNRFIVMLLLLFFSIWGLPACSEATTSTSEDNKEIPEDKDPNEKDPNEKDPNEKDPNEKDPNEKDPDEKEPEEGSAEYWARGIIDGKVDKLEAFMQISHTSGFPVYTQDDTYIFMHWHDQGDWAVAGDFNDWNLEGMKRVGEDIWYAEVSVTEAQGSGYKFVQNGENYQADPWATAFSYDEHGEISFVTPPDAVHLRRWRHFEGQGLLPRNIQAYVPKGQGPFNVLYMHDGQNLFDTKAMHGGWRLFETLQDMEAAFLVVGIDNSSDRMHEYTHVDDIIGGTMYETKGEAYAKFVHEDVRNLIEHHLPTTETRGLMGSSLGGLISAYIAHLYPDSYHFVGALSATFVWGRLGGLKQVTMRELYVAEGVRDFIIYADSGGSAGPTGCKTGQEDALEDEDDRDNYCATMDFVNALENLGYEYQKNLFHWYEANAGHNEAAWAARVFRPLGLFADL